MRMAIHKEVVALGILNAAACVINDVTVHTDSSMLEPEVDALFTTLATDPNIILSRPEVLGFKTLFGQMGYPSQTPAGHRLIQSVRKRGFKSYNNLVDSYNIVSAEFGSGIGMHDTRCILADVHVCRATAAQQIVPLFKNAPVFVRPGDIIYRSGHELMAWLGERDVDSDQFKITDATTSVLLIALGNAATSLDYNRSICTRAFDLIRRTSPRATLGGVDVEYV